MGWLLLVALGIIWAVFLLPVWRFSPHRSVEGFVRDMELLADTEDNGRGRWIVTPRKGVAFVGTRERAKERARERRRRVFVLMLESIGLSFLIGVVPPLRAMWYATGVLLVLLGAYVWLLVSTKAHGGPVARRGARSEAAEGGRPAPHGVAPDAGRRTPRPAVGGLAAFAPDDLENIVVRRAGRRVGVAGV